MKRSLYIMLILCLLFSFTGCNSDENKIDKQTKENSENVSDNNNETDNNEVQNNDEEKNDNSDENKELKNLEGKDLMKAFINHKQAENYYYKAIIKSNDSDMGEVEFEVVNYRVGKSTRTESDGMGEKSIMIYNDNEKVLYYYIEGETQGSKINRNEKPKDQMFDTDMKYDKDEAFDNLVKAEITDLDGEEVIYSEFNVDNKGIVKTWYSIEKNFPILYTVENDENKIITEFKVVEFEEGDFSDKLIPDQNVTFVQH